MRYALLLLLAVGGCSLVTAPDAWPTNVQPFTPPVVYATYWTQMQTCSGITADFARVSWFKSEGALNTSAGLGGHAFGLSDWPTHRIAIAGEQVTDGATVRHEMLHDLLQTDGHPEAYFGVGGKCFAEVSH